MKIANATNIKMNSETRVQENKELRKVSDDFESLFVNELLKVMRQGVSKSSLIEATPGRTIFEGMLDDEYSKIIAEKRQFGVSDMVYDYLNKKMGK